MNRADRPVDMFSTAEEREEKERRMHNVEDVRAIGRRMFEQQPQQPTAVEDGTP